MTAAFAFAAAVLAAPPSVSAAATDSAVPVRLVRCVAGRALPCLVTRISVPGAAAPALASIDSSDEARAWTGILGGARLIGPTVSTPRAIVPPLRLLVLLDRSGSMIGEGIAFTRLTLRSFIAGLDSATSRVAVAGFESRDVNRGIDAATFVSPSEAVRALEGLAVSDRQANTALYSALVRGVARVAAARAESPGAQGAILLVTDGRNDVGHARDDPGLLAGSDGLRTAAAAASASGDRIWIMGVGENLSAPEIATLAGGGSATTAALDPNAMAARLGAIGRELRGVRDLTFGVQGGAAAALARAPWAGAAAVWRDGRPIVTQALAWAPPLFALPAYEGVAAAGSVPVALRDADAAGGPGGMRWLMAACFALLGAVLWVVAPRYAWRGAAPSEAPAPPSPSAASSRPAAPAAAGSLRTDVQEAPPRRPGDVTRELPVVNAASTPSRPAPGS